jgi:hypothetical protein
MLSGFGCANAILVLLIDDGLYEPWLPNQDWTLENRLLCYGTNQPFDIDRLKQNNQPD